MATESESTEVGGPMAVQTDRTVPYAPYPVAVQLGETITSTGMAYVVMEFQDMGGDRTYFVTADYATRMASGIHKIARSVMSKEQAAAKLIDSHGKVLL